MSDNEKPPEPLWHGTGEPKLEASPAAEAPRGEPVARDAQRDADRMEAAAEAASALSTLATAIQEHGSGVSDVVVPIAVSLLQLGEGIPVIAGVARVLSDILTFAAGNMKRYADVQKAGRVAVDTSAMLMTWLQPQHLQDIERMHPEQHKDLILRLGKVNAVLQLMKDKARAHWRAACA